MKFFSVLAATSTILGAAVAAPAASEEVGDTFYLKINGGGEFNGQYVDRDSVDDVEKAVASEDHGGGYNLISNTIATSDNGTVYYGALDTQGSSNQEIRFSESEQEGNLKLANVQGKEVLRPEAKGTWYVCNVDGKGIVTFGNEDTQGCSQADLVVEKL
ncbi:hypothetical protein TRICI_002850 [Trichomonascus ciferrii]|uniref:Uncharacterized protein n=1 Tax=Trichomonascus ciferrii TaxID=44093 RepID=A0A642VAP6_9ASCO|nr:hypothetical protein TRICI_002850 [Trichomonascus ciferrii]